MTHLFNKILIAVDQSEASMRAARVGCSIAMEMGAQVLLVHVVNHPPAGDGTINTSRSNLVARLRRKGRSLLRRMRGIGGERVRIAETLREGIPAEEILAAAAEWGAHLIVLGAYRRSQLGNLLLGSTAETIARRARCPVVTVGDESDVLQQIQESAVRH